MTSSNKQTRAQTKARQIPAHVRPVALSARDPLAYAAALKILG